MGPYGEAAWAYRRAGWAGVLPLPPAAKGPVPRGFTGWAGVDPSGADVQAWIDGGHDAGNIAIRLPHTVYGLDVDDYGGKTGGAALARLVEAFGPLPPTWISSSREDSVSGIRFYRAELAVGTRWRDEPAGHGAGIEAIHFGHRYAVVWPSMHPETGRKYAWRRPDGIATTDEIPRPETLPVLPQRWALGLAEAGETRVGDMAGHDETVETVTAWRVGEPCPRVAAAHERALGGLSAAAAGAALHPAAVAALHELTNLGHEGHVGVRRILAEHFAMFVEVRAVRAATGDARRAAEGEWWRMVRGAVGKLPQASQREVCDCDLWSGAGLLFDPWPDRDGNALTPDAVSTVSAETGQDLPVELDAAAAMLARMLTPEQIAARPAPAPLVAGLLYRDTLTWLIGKSGAFKSFVMLDIAAHVADGREWAGRRVWGGPVVYVAAEGAGGMTLRVRAWIARHGPMSERLMMLPEPVQVRGDGWGVLVEACRRAAPVLIVVDTQARVTVGVKENDNAEMGAFIEQLDRLRRATGACVAVVHHIGRQGDDARGASAIDGAQDTELKVERLGGPKALTARLTIDKQKDAPDTATVPFALELVELGPDPATGEPLSSLVVVPDLFADPIPRAPWEVDDIPERLGRIMRVLHEQFGETGATGAQALAILREQGWSKQYPRTTFYRCWDRLISMEKIAKIHGTQRFILIDPRDGAGEGDMPVNVRVP